MLYITLYNYIICIIWMFFLDFGTVFGTRVQFWVKSNICMPFSPNSGPEPSFGVENGPKQVFRPKLKPGPELGAEIEKIYNRI